MNFKRWDSRNSYSWAFIVFKSYHTSLNRMIWVNNSSINFVSRSVSNSDDNIHDFFNVPEENKRAITNNKEDWKDYYKEFQNWNRLNAIMAMSSYFEVYLTSIMTTAIESNPGILHNVSKKIDGVQIMKHSDKYSYSDKADEVVKGDWSKRNSKIKSIFGSLPIEFKNEHSSLEKIRKLRNKVGHAFGRDIDKAKEKGTIQILEIERITFQTMQKYMKIIYKCAEVFDKELLNNHIGSYEELFFYHQLEKKNPYNDGLGDKTRKLKKAIGKEGLSPASKEYCKQLITYYDNL